MFRPLVSIGRGDIMQNKKNEVYMQFRTVPTMKTCRTETLARALIMNLIKYGITCSSLVSNTYITLKSLPSVGLRPIVIAPPSSAFSRHRTYSMPSLHRLPGLVADANSWQCNLISHEDGKYLLSLLFVVAFLILKLPRTS